MTGSSSSTRQERRQAARDDAKAQRAVDTTSPLSAATPYLRQDELETARTNREALLEVIEGNRQ